MNITHIIDVALLNQITVSRCTFHERLKQGKVN